MNDTGSNNQEPHVHWHFSPRYNNPVNFNNEVFTDENYPRTNKNPRLTDQETLIKIAEKLRG
jgi:diadenosine tetraphosphate (Ap4A) HIT family hydrolase